MDGRLGSLAEEFKQLVYPPGYDPDGKTIKRKQGGMKEYREKTIVSLNAYALFKFANIVMWDQSIPFSQNISRFLTQGS